MGKGKKRRTKVEPQQKPTSADAQPVVEETKAADSSPAEALDEKALVALQERAAERDRFLELLKRERADLLNYQKRVRREQEELRKFALQEFLTEMLPILDDLERALSAAQEGHDVEVLLQGVEMLQGKLEKLLQQAGVKEIETSGRCFDPSYHEAVVQEETDARPDLAILEELQKGYLLHERVLRPARVKVSRRKQPEEAQTPAACQDRAASSEQREPHPSIKPQLEEEEKS